jgi:hypothetical protein
MSVTNPKICKHTNKFPGLFSMEKIFNSPPNAHKPIKPIRPEIADLIEITVARFLDSMYLFKK